MADATQAWSVGSKQEYQDKLAPFDVAEDFSTASLMKNKGPNLTMEGLGALSVEQMVREVLKKASIIDYERLCRIVKGACDLSKQELTKEKELIDSLVSTLCLVTSVDGVLVCRSNIKYDLKTEKRSAALRDYFIHQLEARGGKLDLPALFKATQSSYSELKTIVEELSDVKGGVCYLKSYKGSTFKGKLSQA